MAAARVEIAAARVEVAAAEEAETALVVQAVVAPAVVEDLMAAVGWNGEVMEPVI